MRILVVEDEPKTGDYLKKGLGESGFVVDVASDGITGLHLAQQQGYDLIVLDVMLPGMDGWRVLRRLREGRDTRATPVIFLTARDALDPAEELARQADYFQDLADERELRLATAVVGSEPLRADTMLLRRALANLLANAVQYAKPGSEVRLGARRRPGAWELSVDNSGEPPPAELLDRLFERFYRADSARSSGLGLAIVRSIMTLHGGSATVVQPAAGDISFRLRFPDAVPPAASPAAPAAGARS